MRIDCTRPPLEYASEHERNLGGGLDEHALEQHEPMAAERRPVGGTGPYVPLQRGTDRDCCCCETHTAIAI